MPTFANDDRPELVREFFPLDRLIDYLRMERILESCSTSIEKIRVCNAQCEDLDESLNGTVSSIQWLMHVFYSPEQIEEAKVRLVQLKEPLPGDPLEDCFTVQDTAAVRHELTRLNGLMPLMERLRTGRFDTEDMQTIYQGLLHNLEMERQHLMPSGDAMYGTQTEAARER